MSGGVDSSVAALVLRDQGHEVTGATLRLWGGPSDSGCCSVADVDDARRVAQVLGVDHHVFNYADEFAERVIEPYAAEHARGRTPNPCIECNRHVKFDLLTARARRLGFDAVATGHHARVVERAGRRWLARGVDRAKDQSYVLGYLRAEQLDRLVLPIGEMTKDEVRDRARDAGLRTWSKPDSQDVCFIRGDHGRAEFLRERIDLTPATVVDRATGEVVGDVPAAELMTVGQRRGIAPDREGARRYVANVDLVARRVEVDRLAGVVTASIALHPHERSAVHEWPTTGSAVHVQTSAHGPLARARVDRDEVGPVLRLDAAIRPVAAGQTIVLYGDEDPDLVLAAAVVR